MFNFIFTADKASKKPLYEQLYSYVADEIKNKNINIKESWIVLVAGIIGTIISAKLSSKMNVELLRKMFGIFLLIIAIYEIYSWYKTYIKKEKGHTRSNQKCNMKG